MKKQIIAIMAVAVLLSVSTNVSSNAMNTKVNLTAASTSAATYSEWGQYGYEDGEYDRLNGNPYHTTFNPPVDWNDKKDYQLGYLAGFKGE